MLRFASGGCDGFNSKEKPPATGLPRTGGFVVFVGRFAMKHIHVTCAIIERDGLVLAAQRNENMSLPLKWEFPGGKIDSGETPEECLRRELIEEMGIRVDIEKALSNSTHHYANFTVTLYPFVCSIESGEVVLHEHKAIAWLPPESLHLLDWAEADVPVVESYCLAREGAFR